MMHASKLFRNIHKTIQLSNIGKSTPYYQVTFFLNFLDKKTGRISIQAWWILCLIVPLRRRESIPVLNGQPTFNSGSLCITVQASADEFKLSICELN
jgi:hypothetical protein